MANSKEDFIKWVYAMLDAGIEITTNEDNIIIGIHEISGTYMSNFTLEDLKKLSE